MKDHFRGNLQNRLKKEALGIDFRHYCKNLVPRSQDQKYGSNIDRDEKREKNDMGSTIMLKFTETMIGYP